MHARLSARILTAALSLALCSTLGVAGCKGPAGPPTLAELRAIDDPSKAGARLMEAPRGLTRLDPEAGAQRAAIVAVHGFDSGGKEWVEPLLTLADNGAEIYFFRWNDKQCPESGANDLEAALRDLVGGAPQLDRITVLAHSYGGVIAALTAQRAPLGKPVDLHIIASPLASVPKMRQLCDFTGVPEAAATGADSWRQWRTVHAADGAFRDLEVDPQVAELPDLEVTALPETYEDGRLGHNRAITYVTRELDPQLTVADGG
ncbi:MAG: alpha/beta hydrolase [Myxococcales bacterium]|nr:alpha/beta hydrolase [Myxococcales bacterium]